MNRLRALIVFGGDTAENSDRLLFWHCQRLADAMEKLGASAEVVDLGDWPLPPKNARKSKEIPEGLYALADKARQADILVLASPVHWRFPSALSILFIAHILAPLEWGGLKGGGFENWGKTFATLAVCDDDGASAMNALLEDMAGHMGMSKPRWCTLHKNFEMPRSEDDWHNYVELLAPILIESAERDRNFPSITEILRRAPPLPQ